jgi:superfamily II DNA or RNA helicase
METITDNERPPDAGIVPKVQFGKGKQIELRRFQQEFYRSTSDAAIGAKRFNEIIACVTPGGGKSILPILCEPLLRGVAQKILWVVPRVNLGQDAEQKSAVFGMPLRFSGNDTKPHRGLVGYITTYQAICAAPNLHAHEFANHRYILVLDEPHHIGEDSVTVSAIAPLWNAAVFRVMMSGTMERWSGEKIAFLPYAGRLPDLNTTEERKCITYSRGEALRDDVIVPLEFFHVDGAAQWIDANGNKHEEESIAGNGALASQMIYTVLRTEYAFQLLRDCVNHWLDHRAKNPWAQLLVITHSVERAKEMAARVRELFSVEVEVATGDDPKANKSIALFCSGKIPAISTCQMAYEGMDAPRVTHIACLTHIRSKPWIEQMFARAVRKFQTKSKAWVFCPDDPLMNDVISAISAEQVECVKERVQPAQSLPGDAAPLGSVDDQFIVPLGSEATGKRFSQLDGMVEISPGALEWIRQHGNLDPASVAFAFKYCGQQVPEVDAEHEPTIITQSQEEKKLRSAIQEQCNRLDYMRGAENGFTNKQLLRKFGVARKDMNLEQLGAVWRFLAREMSSFQR